MPRYFFHDIGSPHRDMIGVVLPDRPTAHIEAIRLIGSLRAEQPELLSGGRFGIEVTNDAGDVLFVVTAVAGERVRVD